jgi:hypothetical protein
LKRDALCVHRTAHQCSGEMQLRAYPNSQRFVSCPFVA